MLFVFRDFHVVPVLESLFKDATGCLIPADHVKKRTKGIGNN